MQTSRHRGPGQRTSCQTGTVSTHTYTVTATWTGNRGTGTSGYRDYDRSVTLSVAGKPDVLGSADVPFHGDPARWNPEDKLLASLAECHMLSYFYACTLAGVEVTSYVDTATGTIETAGNGGRFTEAVLRPAITVRDQSMVQPAIDAHGPAHEWCFIANSVNFPIRIEPVVTVG